MKKLCVTLMIMHLGIVSNLSAATSLTPFEKMCVDFSKNRLSDPKFDLTDLNDPYWTTICNFFMGQLRKDKSSIRETIWRMVDEMGQNCALYSHCVVNLKKLPKKMPEIIKQLELIIRLTRRMKSEHASLKPTGDDDKEILLQAKLRNLNHWCIIAVFYSMFIKYNCGLVEGDYEAATEYNSMLERQYKKLVSQLIRSSEFCQGLKASTDDADYLKEDLSRPHLSQTILQESAQLWKEIRESAKDRVDEIKDYHATCVQDPTLLDSMPMTHEAQKIVIELLNRYSFFLKCFEQDAQEFEKSSEGTGIGACVPEGYSCVTRDSEPKFASPITPQNCGIAFVSSALLLKMPYNKLSTWIRNKKPGKKGLLGISAVVVGGVLYYVIS